MRHEGSNELVPFVAANIIPGGEFVIVLFPDGQVDLREIKIKPEGEWELPRVARHQGLGYLKVVCMTHWSQLRTDANLEHPLIAYVDGFAATYVTTISRHHYHRFGYNRFDSLYFPRQPRHRNYPTEAGGKARWRLRLGSTGHSRKREYYTVLLRTNSRMGHHRF